MQKRTFCYNLSPNNTLLALSLASSERIIRGDAKGKNPGFMDIH